MHWLKTGNFGSFKSDKELLHPSRLKGFTIVYPKQIFKCNLAISFNVIQNVKLSGLHFIKLNFLLFKNPKIYNYIQY